MGRLFWKIFGWFWVVMLLMGFGISWAMSQLMQDTEREAAAARQSRFIQMRINAVAAILEHSGETAARAVLRQTGDSSRVRILVFDSDGRELLGRAAGPNTVSNARRVVAPSGHSYRLLSQRNSLGRGIATVLRAPSLASPPPLRRAERSSRFAGTRGWSYRPELYWLRFALAVLVSGLVCFWLAWYLTRPLRYLRTASQCFAEGDLDARVGNAMGLRRDEISDLGREFDRMADKLQSMVNGQKQLLNDLSHELRSPLARLQVATGIARQRGGGKLLPELERIEREGERLNELVGQMLSLSRLEAGAATVDKEEVELSALLQEVVRDADFEAQARHRRVCLHAMPPCKVRGNAELLFRALENVLRNAVKYTGEGTEVVVKGSFSALEQKVVIRVSDAGAGVSDELLEHLFEPFVRAAEARDRVSGGFGLGLAIARRAVLFHGGEIRAENRAKGGLCIEIRLPVVGRTVSA